MISCKCGAIFTDGGREYIRRGGADLDFIEDLTVYADESNNIIKARRS